MGNCGSSTAEEDPDANKRSRAIDKTLEEDAKTMRKECKLLLLGMELTDIAVPLLTNN